MASQLNTTSPSTNTNSHTPEPDTNSALFQATIEHHLKPIQSYLEDASISEVMVNAYNEIYIEQHGSLIKTDARFTDVEAYEAAVNNILQFTGRNVTDDQPLMDGRLPDGSRVHVAREPCARHGTVMAIRKFSKQMLDIDWLSELGSITPAACEYLNLMITAEQNLLVAGGTSAGKTSLLNALSAYIPNGERVVIIEDSAELQLQQSHVISMEARPADRYGHGGVTIRDLFRSSLRLRPDRIVIGEVRGGEALDMIQAMTSGHGGSMGTLHAETPADALNRLETMALMSQVDLPLHAIRAQIASAIDVVVQMSRHMAGRRLVTQITEVVALHDDQHYELRDIFHLDRIDNPEPNQPNVQLLPTGETSTLANHLSPELESKVTDLTRDIFKLDR